MDDLTSLPFIDEHAVTVLRPRPVVWDAVDRGATVALCGEQHNLADRLLGCRDPGGFHVHERIAERRLVLDGRHRFARYRLELLLRRDDDATTTVLARSYASFPGLHGRLYEALVVKTRFHVIATRALLRRIVASA